MTFRMTLAALGIGLAMACVNTAYAGSDNVTYTYDSFGRIQMLTYANGTTITYSYDLATNRLSQTVVCSSSGC
jgi:YD repeat-containing protein